MKFVIALFVRKCCFLTAAITGHSHQSLDRRLPSTNCMYIKRVSKKRPTYGLV